MNYNEVSSDCCGALSSTSIEDNIGICSECKEHAEFN